MPTNPSPKAAAATHLVIIPAYNAGSMLESTVRSAMAQWQPVWVVDDGSSDGSGEALAVSVKDEPGVKVMQLPHNQGKGAAVLYALERAERSGFTHALTMDADGQHPAADIGRFMQASIEQPGAMILGRPVFDAGAPALRVKGRRISNWWANLETLGHGIGDSLFGFRVYPIAPLRNIMNARPWMRRFDFDVEAVVRLSWRGVTPVNLDAPVRYPRPEDGGVSHFRYGRDNMLLTWMHIRLCAEFLLRLPGLLWRRLRA